MSRSQITKKLGIGFGVVILLFIAILTFASFETFDEPLSTGVSQALQKSAMPADQDNAFIAIWGLSTSSDKNMIESGRALIQRYRYNRDSQGRDELTEEDYQEILANKDMDKAWQSIIPKCHVRKKQDCTAKLASQIALQPISDQRFDLMMERYKAIRQLKDYQHMDDLTFASPLPSFGPLLSLNKLNLAIALNQNDASVFIQNLESELKFWRMLLNQGDSILDKMIANVGYRNNLAATSNFLSTQPNLSEHDLAKLRQLLSPLSGQELDISEAFLFEEKAFYNTLQNIDAEQLKEALGLSSSPSAWLIQPNATINDYHELFVIKIQELGKMDTPQFAAAIKTKNGESCCFQEMESLSSLSFSSLYNLGGKSLLTATLFNGQDYLARIHDLNGLIGLVGVELNLLTDRASTERWLKENTVVLGHSIRFDPKIGTLEFDCLDSHSICKLKL